MLEELINNIILRCNWLQSDQVQKLKQAMYIEMHDMRIEKKTYELCETNDNYALLQKFMAVKKMEGLSNGTLERYYYDTNKMLLELNIPVRDITKDDVLYYLARYQQTRKISKVTLRNMIRYISAFFNWLEEEEYIQKSPCRNIKAPKTEKIIKKAFTDEELEGMRNSVGNIRDRALIEFLNCTGARISEAIGVNISDIDYKKQVCKVFGKGSKERYVYITDTAMYYLNRYIESRKDDKDILFVTNDKNARRISRQTAEDVIRKLGRKIHANAHPHKFRRTFATKAINRGMPIQNVSMLMGHVKLDTTLLYLESNNRLVEQSFRKHIA